MHVCVAWYVYMHAHGWWAGGRLLAWLYMQVYISIDL